MSTTPTIYIEGPALFAPTLPGWETARAAFRGEGALTGPPTLMLEVGTSAIYGSGH